VSISTRPLGRTGISPTELGLGCGPFGGIGRAVDDAAAEGALEAAWSGGIRYFDTAPWYGLGTSEHRLGRFLRSKARDEFVVSTKVGRVLSRPRDPRSFQPTTLWANALPFEWRFDYRHDAVLRSFEDSLQRLGLNRVELLLIHDLDVGVHGGASAFAQRVNELDRGGGFRALAELRDEGAVDGIGAGLNESGSVARLLERFDLDVCLLAGRYTLLEQDALDEALPLCEERGVSVMIGGVFNSGILATGPVAGATYEYEEAPREVVERVRLLAEACSRHDVELPAAALQFPLAHPSVAAVIAGAESAAEVGQNLARFARPIPGRLWTALREEGLIRADAPVPAAVT
jgi:D-threo-aldose 1-dehydrogenase